TTADGKDFHYIQAAVDRSMTASADDAKSQDDMAQAVLLVYRVTEKPQYYKAAQSLYGQLANSDRAESFRAAYAATFHQQGDFAGIAKQLMNAKMPRGEYAMA